MAARASIAQQHSLRLKRPHPKQRPGIAANAAAPAASYVIGQEFKRRNAEGSLGHLLAHATLGGLTAAAGGNDPLAGALSSGGAEAAAGYISGLFSQKDGSRLSTEQKETVTAIAGLIGTAAGAALGSTSADVAQGSLNAKNAVENNGILDRDGLTPDERRPRVNLTEKYGTNIDEIANMIKNGKLVLTKELTDYLYTINKNPNLIITVPDPGKPLSVVLLNEKNGWRLNRAKPNEEIHDARVAFTSFSQWAVFGKVSVSRDKNTGSLRIIPDAYDFEMQEGIRKIPRNIETFLGSPGLGTPFKIDFRGKIKIE